MRVPDSVDDYIAGFPDDVQRILRKIRDTVRAAAPDADESVTYKIPTFKLNGRPLFYFAAFKAHIGLYPMTAPVKAKFRKELSEYEQSKGTVRLPLDGPIPYGLIGRIVKFKVEENAQAARKGRAKRRER